jgi:hypothetical protein
MKVLRYTLSAIGVLFALVFGVPTIWQRIRCDFLSSDACDGWAHPAVVELWASHRNAWLVGAGTYALVVAALFRTELLAASRGRRVLGLFVLAVCTVALAVLLE